MVEDFFGWRLLTEIPLQIYNTTQSFPSTNNYICWLFVGVLLKENMNVTNKKRRSSVVYRQLTKVSSHLYSFFDTCHIYDVSMHITYFILNILNWIL